MGRGRPSALALTMVALAEGLLTARRYAERNHYPVDANAELLAFAGIQRGRRRYRRLQHRLIRVQDIAVDQVGKVQIPLLVVASLAIALLLWGTALLKSIPAPALAAVVAIAVLPIVGIAELCRAVVATPLRNSG